MPYEPVIGMEVHLELETASKMFCACSAVHFLVPPNRNICPVCTAQPGSLPVINERAVELTVMAGMALNCKIRPKSVFARKNYVYPDLPKGYQISQYEEPLCVEGWVAVEATEGGKQIGVARVHLEEDTGKLVHEGNASLVDYNRAGVPLMEIVSDSSMRSAEEACDFLQRIRQVARYLGVSSGDMEKGAMRCEANISVRPAGSSAYGTKVEVKNLNSFRSVRNAIAYEVQRQTRILDGGGNVIQVTMGWDEDASITREQRSKETSEDYRYFPEPDLLNLEIEEGMLARLRQQLPELPAAKAVRFAADYGLNARDIGLLVEDRNIADYFEDCAGLGNADPKQVSNWVSGEVFRRLKEGGSETAEIRVDPEALVELIALVKDGTINQNAAKEIFAVLWEEGGKVAEIVAARGLRQISDAAELEAVLVKIIGENPDAVEKIKGGNEKPVKFLMGQVMRATRGKANPRLVEELLRRQLAV